jgi:hypothetical protein
MTHQKRLNEQSETWERRERCVHVQPAHSACWSAVAVAWSAASQLDTIHSPASAWKAVLLQMQLRSVLKRVVSGKRVGIRETDGHAIAIIVGSGGGDTCEDAGRDAWRSSNRR